MPDDHEFTDPDAIHRRHSLAFRAAPIAGILWDADGRITGWNPRATELFGWTRDEALGRTILGLLVPPDAVEGVSEIIDRLKAGASPLRSVNKNLTRRGDLITCAWNNAVMFDEHGEFAGVISLALDVTEQERIQRALIESMHSNFAPIDASADVLALIAPDGTVAAANQACADHCGCSKDELIGSCIFDHFDPAIAAERRTRVQEAVTSGRVVRYTDERRGCTFDNALVPVVGDDGEVTGVALFARDVTELLQARERLEASEERYRTFFERVPAALYRGRPTGEIVDANPALVKLLGYPDRTSLLNVNSHALYVDPEMQQQVAHILKTQGRIRDMEYRLCRSDGTPVWVRDNCSAVRNAQGEIDYYEGALVDITQQKEAEEQLLRMAHHDTLTGLFNRSRFDEELHRALARARRYDERGALAYVDLDNFKGVNDEYGHQVGDLVLAAVARRLEARLRETDILARVGGDEFSVLMPGVDAENAVFVVNQLLTTLSGEPLHIGGHRFTMYASIGIALFPAHGDTAQALMTRADKAMYAAKRHGGTVELFCSDDD